MKNKATEFKVRKLKTNDAVGKNFDRLVVPNVQGSLQTERFTIERQILTPVSHYSKWNL